MEFIGKVYGAGPSGEILVRCERPWRWGEGARIVDRRGRVLGRVEGIIGPVAAPWLVLSPADPREGTRTGERIKGSDAYIEEVPSAERQAPERPRTRGRPTGPPEERPRKLRKKNQAS